MSLTKVPSHSSLSDRQFLQVAGPDGLLTGFQYDAQQRTLYAKDSQVIYPSFHGATHIAEDPVPEATCDTRGLMSADDKCKLDALLQTRVGVLGFQGAGFPDDGGWLQGDIILAAGTEFISLERIGNVVRFTVDSPVPLNCACESCASIFWVQDETDVNAVRPPTCSGKMPGANVYGELKVYLFPESAIFDPNNPTARLNQKGRYPGLIFKRYDDSNTPGNAELEVVLRRDQNNLLQTEVGWAFTPGVAGTPECVYFMGKDQDGNQLRFDMKAESIPGMVGQMLYKGHLLTKKMGVITNYTTNVLTTNQYTCKFWDVDRHRAVGEPFTVTNVWQYNNPLAGSGGVNPQSLVLDVTIDLLPVGTLVDVWYFKAGEVAGVPINRYYINKRPELNPRNLWTQVGSVAFGDEVVLRAESTPDGGSDDKDAGYTVPGGRCLERSIWGVSGFDDPLMLYDTVNDAGTTDGAALNLQHRAVIDPALPGLRVLADDEITGNYSERPVTIWNRHEVSNAYVRVELGRPAGAQAMFPPVDLLLQAPVDSADEVYLRVVATGTVAGNYFARIKGAQFRDLPSRGILRILTPGARFNRVFRYGRKLVWTGSPDDDLDSLVLLADDSTNAAFPGNAGDIVELLHEDYSAPCVRLEFTPAGDTADSVGLQVKVGELDVTAPYEQDALTDDRDDYVRGLGPGHAVSQVFTQSAAYTGVGQAPSSVPSNFVVYDGGAQAGGDQEEYWNRLEVLYRDGQCWVWWNGMLVPPSEALSAALPAPVAVNTPYFPLAAARRFGKVGLRLWPGAAVRSLEVRTQSKSFSEFSYGQLEIGG